MGGSASDLTDKATIPCSTSTQVRINRVFFDSIDWFLVVERYYSRLWRTVKSEYTTCLSCTRRKRFEV